MSKTKESDTHRQCKLQKGSKIYFTWIPQKYAVKGKNLRIKMNGEWETGWVVVDVWGSIKSLEIEKRQYEHKHHRDRTDI
jgi:hypothetical protein